MKDYASKAYLRPATAASNDEQAARREQAYRRTANGMGWAACLLIGALIGYNVSLRQEPKPIPRLPVRGQLTMVHCVTYDGCRVCEKRGPDFRIIYATMAC